MVKKAIFDLATLRTKARAAHQNPVSIGTDGPDGMVFLQSKEMQSFNDALSPAIVLALLDDVASLKKSVAFNPPLPDGTTLFDRFMLEALGGVLASVGQSSWQIAGKTITLGKEYADMAAILARASLEARQTALREIEGATGSGNDDDE